jgi:iron complex outermembrane receptor protein
MMRIRSQMLALTLLVVPAWAETNQTIVVEATRLDHLDLMAVATAADVTAMDRDTLERSGAGYVPELLQSEANLLIRSTSGNEQDGQISLRGFGEGSHLRTLVLVDGHRLNRPDMGGIEWGTLPVSSIESIEVVRGGQSVLYGNAALAGVVKVTTRSGADAGCRMGVSVGSDGYWGSSFGYGGAAGDVDYSVGIDAQRADGFRRHSAYSSTQFSSSLVWYAGDLDTVTLRVSGADLDAQLPGSLTKAEMKADPTQAGSGAGQSDTRSGQVTLLWDGERAWGAARLAAGLNVRDLDWELDGLYGRNQMVGFSFGPRVRVGSADDFVLGGVDVRYDALDFDSLHPDNTDYVQAYAEIERLSAAPYLFAQRRLNPVFLLNGGVRFEHARSDNTYVDYVDNQILPTEELLGIGTVVNPNYTASPDADPTQSYAGLLSKNGWAAEVALAVAPNEAVSAWLGYDRVYRYPTLDETAAYQGYALSDPLNENLDPETGHNFEIGTRLAAGSWSGTASLFYLMMNDEIVFDDDENLNRNIGQTRRMGTEFMLRYEQKRFGATAGWALVDARLHGGENDGHRIPLVPWANGSLQVWFAPVEQVRLTASGQFVSDQYRGGDEANAEEKVAGYGVLGARANWTLSESLTLHFSIHNLLDKVYASSVYGDAYYPAAGRSFRLGFNLEF